MKIVGIDPGLSGAIAIMENNKVLSIFDMPIMAEGKKNKKQLNSAQLVKIIKENIKSLRDNLFLINIKKNKMNNPNKKWREAILSPVKNIANKEMIRIK